MRLPRRHIEPRLDAVGPGERILDHPTAERLDGGGQTRRFRNFGRSPRTAGRSILRGP